MNKQKFVQTLRSKCGPAFLILLVIKILFSVIGYFILRRWPIIPVSVIDSLNLPSTLYMGDVSCHLCYNYSAGILIEPQHLDCNNSDVMLVAIVASSRDERDRRNSIRKTWGSVKEYNGLKIRTYFVVESGVNTNDTENDNEKYRTTATAESSRAGFKFHNGMSNNNATYNYKRTNLGSIISTKLQSLQDEIKEYDDIIVVNMKESFGLHTNKTMVALRWVTERCGRARYVMKTDIDSFNILSRFIEYLRPIVNKNLIGGLCTTGEYPDRRNTSRYYVSEDMYPGSIYPLHAKGRAYILSIPAAVQVLSVGSQIKSLPMEDVFVTGSSRAVAGISCSNMPVLIPRDAEKLTDCDIATWVGNVPSIQNSDDMFRLWNMINNGSHVENCKRQNQYEEFRDVYKERSTWTILAILTFLIVVTVMLLCVVCHVVKRHRCKELSNTAKGYKKVSDDEKFEINNE